MNEENTWNTSKTDWARLETMGDEEIDYSDIPPLNEEFFNRAQLTLINHVAIAPDVLAWFKSQSGKYPDLINRVLREYMELKSQ